MRIISQDREFDTPYEKVLLYVIERSEKYHIFVSFGFDETYDYSIGAYNTKERCLEIMQEIREIAVGKPIACNYLSEEEYRTLMEESKKLSVQSLAASDVDMKVIGETYFFMPEE